MDTQKCVRFFNFQFKKILHFQNSKKVNTKANIAKDKAF